eukprot:358599_1
MAFHDEFKNQVEDHLDDPQSDCDIIQNLILRYDTNGAISEAIMQCMEQNEFTLQLLSTMPISGIKLIINSWNFDTKPITKHVIVDLLATKIKNLQKCDLNLVSPMRITDSEVKYYDMLDNLEKTVIQLTDKFENESKIISEMSEQNANQNKIMINETFDQLIEKINQRRDQSLQQFDNKLNMHLNTTMEKK